MIEKQSFGQGVRENVKNPVLIFCASMLLAAATASAQRPQPGAFRLQRNGDRFSLEANRAPLADVVDAISRSVSSGIRFGEVPDKAVTAHYPNVTLEQLLERLGVSFVLIYQRPEPHLKYELTDAWLMEEAVGIVPAHIQFIRSWIKNMEDDYMYGNATAALNWLCSNYGPEVERELIDALTSDDWQVRQYAAHILIDRYSGNDPVAKERLIKAIIEGLRDDGADIPNQRTALSYLFQHPEWVNDYKALFAEKLHSDDRQQRLLCAALLAINGRTE